MQRAAARAKAASHPLRALVHRRRHASLAAYPPEWRRWPIAQLDAVRDAVVAKMRATIRAGMGTEARRSALMQMVPEDVGLKSDGDGEGPQSLQGHCAVGRCGRSVFQYDVRAVGGARSPAPGPAGDAGRTICSAHDRAVDERCAHERHRAHRYSTRRERSSTPTWARITRG